jgi:hypothetical protein
MTALGRSTGRDQTIVVIDGSGNYFPLGNILDYKEKQETTKQRVKPINAQNAELSHFDGWSGTIQVERMSPDIETYFALQEANYYAGVGGQACTMQRTIKEPNGAVTQYQYTNVTLTFDNAGEWQQDKSVDLTIGFFAGRRIKQS